jgi:NADH-quinone oxidoreductase subunit A
MLAEYLNIVVFFAFAVGLSLIIIALPKLLAKEVPQKDKLKSYECGFDAFDDARGKFDVKFYLVAILFHYIRFRNYFFDTMGSFFE